jgi:2-dehydropantoate 2-reductase
MRVLVMGAGGVGGYYGGMLARSGEDVSFVARGRQLEALREKGLELRTQGRTLLIHPARTVERPNQVETPPDLVLFTVKTYDTVPALEALGPAVGPDTAVLTLQNGIDSVDQIVAAFGADRVLAGVTYVASSVVEPGVVHENGFSRRVVFGEPDGRVTPRAEAILAAFKRAELEAELSTNPRQALWDKFVLVAPHATISSLCQTPIGVTRETPEAMALYRTMVGEVKAVGEAAGFAFAPDTAERIVTSFMGAPPGQVSSMQRDYAAQRRVELEALTGTVVRRGEALGVPTPAFRALYAVLKVRASTFGGLS